MDNLKYLQTASNDVLQVDYHKLDLVLYILLSSTKRLLNPSIDNNLSFKLRVMLKITLEQLDGIVDIVHTSCLPDRMHRELRVPQI